MDLEFSDINFIKGNDRTLCADIPIIDDDLCEEPETFSVTLTEMDSNVVLNGQRRGTVTILDNDGMRVVHGSNYTYM